MKTNQESAVEFLLDKYKSQNTLLFAEDFEQAKKKEKEQRETLLSYIQEVRDLCGKLRFPTEEELRELTIKADVILETFKPEAQ